DDIGFPDFWVNGANQAQGTAGKTRQSRTEGKRQRIDLPCRNPHTRRHIAILHHSAQFQPGIRTIQEPVYHHETYQRQYNNEYAAVRQDQTRHDLPSTTQPGGRIHARLIAEVEPGALLQDKADPPGDQETFEGATVQKTQETALQEYPDCTNHQE